MAVPLRVELTPDRFEAQPGEAFALQVSVRNTSDVVEHYGIDLLGLPQNTGARVEPDVIKLRPGETGSASVRSATSPSARPSSAVRRPGRPPTAHRSTSRPASRCGGRRSTTSASGPGTATAGSSSASPPPPCASSSSRIITSVSIGTGGGRSKKKKKTKKFKTQANIQKRQTKKTSYKGYLGGCPQRRAPSPGSSASSE